MSSVRSACLQRFSLESCLSEALSRCLPQNSLPQRSYMAMEGISRTIFLSLPWLGSRELASLLVTPLSSSLILVESPQPPIASPRAAPCRTASYMSLVCGPTWSSFHVPSSGKKMGHRGKLALSLPHQLAWHFGIEWWMLGSGLTGWANTGMSAASGFPRVTLLLVHSKYFSPVLLHWVW